MEVHPHGADRRARPGDVHAESTQRGHAIGEDRHGAAGRLQLGRLLQHDHVRLRTEARGERQPAEPAADDDDAHASQRR